MKLALVNPPWSFEGSIYFGCREPHLPLELGYTKALAEAEGSDVLLVDAQLGYTWRTGEDGRPLGDVREALASFRPDATAITTAPSYLFWRCPPPELRVPMRALRSIRDVAGTSIAIGPHASTTPASTLEKLGADFAVVGECEGTLSKLEHARSWNDLPSMASRGRTDLARAGMDVKSLPALRWPTIALDRHAHHHHRFEAEPIGPGAEMETSRGCPYHCTFCAKDNYRDAFRKRPLDVVLDELDGLIAAGVRYVYFIDEIFVPNPSLLEALAERDIRFGVQMRIDNWTPALLQLLGKAGCVSIEGGMESISERGRSLLAKHCKLSTEELTELFVVAKKHVPFVQANLLDCTADSRESIEKWRRYLRDRGVWANEPVPMFAYPGSPEYALRFGACDDMAWDRALTQYLSQFEAFSDIQDTAPRPLSELERDDD
jgi:anaerobic magnesium-protoporphyrin IX monomethyl ester cyclase